MDLQIIRKKIKSGDYDLSEHAHKERQQEQVTIKEITKTILQNDIIEKYPSDNRGSSCLIAGKSLHVVCGFREYKLLVITVYRPKKPVWLDYKTRAKELKSRV